MNILEDGRIEHKIRQSDLNRFFMCPEQERLSRLGQLPRKETDAANVGTAMHAGIEAVLKGECAPDNGLDVCFEAWEKLLPDIEFVQTTQATAERYLSNCYAGWLQEIYPQLDAPLAVEASFNFVFHEDDQRVIRLSGQMDFVEEAAVWDWKTAGRPYEQWEIDRFKVQPTVYTLACVELGLLDLGDFPNGIPFVYGISIKGPKPRTQTTNPTLRGPADWAWLKKQCLSLVALVEADLGVWPLQDQGWHCSPKWCSVWDSCKGADRP